MRKSLLIVAVTIISILALVTIAMAADPHVGTWKLNLAKSKYNPPSSAPKSQTVKFEAMDNGFKVLVDGVDADGKTAHDEWAGKYDGKDYPFTGWDAVDTLATKKIDANTFDQTLKKSGKKVGTAREVFSKDGKTLTHTYEIKTVQGQITKVTDVYDKQ